MWERRGLVSIRHPSTSSYFWEYKNRFESLMLTRYENANVTDGQSSNPLEYVVLLIHDFVYQHAWMCMIRLSIHGVAHPQLEGRWTWEML